MRGSIPTKPTYAQNLAQIYKKSNIFMHRFLENLGKTRILPQILAKSPYAYQLYTMPSLHVIALYQIKTFIIMTRKLFNRSSGSGRSTMSGKYYRWGVAYQFTENWQSSVLCEIKYHCKPSLSISC